jgi:hypothetical protein
MGAGPAAVFRIKKFMFQAMKIYAILFRPKILGVLK